MSTSATFGGWQRLPLTRVEDLADAVKGAGLEVTLMSRGPLSGSLAFGEFDGITYTSGLIDARVSLKGPLSQDLLTIGVGLSLSAGTLHWLSPVTTGNVGVFHAGDEHDSLYAPGSLYATATLTVERLEALGARIGVVLDREALGGTAIREGQVPADTLKYLEAMMRQVHAGQAPADSALAGSLLDAMILHCAREPRSAGKPSPSSLLRVVARARAYIESTLDEPISIDAIAAAAGTSRRTLHRAFIRVLGQTPYAYVNTLRLHRIRHDLASDIEARCTVAIAANKWGIAELGRLAGQYRKLFGELPSQTAARPDHQTR